VDLQAVFGERFEKTPGGGEGDFSAVTVEEARSSFIFQRANLRGYSWLGNTQLFGGAGKAFQSAYFQEGSELLEIHLRMNPHMLVGLGVAIDVVYSAYIPKAMEMPA
jgi:hypothetical protein